MFYLYPYIHTADPSLPLYPWKPIPILTKPQGTLGLTPKNPYPWAWVWVFWGQGQGGPWVTQGLPLPIPMLVCMVSILQALVWVVHPPWGYLHLALQEWQGLVQCTTPLRSVRIYALGSIARGRGCAAVGKGVGVVLFFFFESVILLVIYLCS